MVGVKSVLLKTVLCYQSDQEVSSESRGQHVSGYGGGIGFFVLVVH